MKSIISCAAVFAFAFAAQADNTKVEPKEGKCEIVFPGKPTEKPGDKSLQIIMETLEGKGALMLQYNDMPNKIPTDNAEAVKKILDGGQGGLTQALKGKILKSEDGKFGDHPSRDIDMEVPMLGVYRVKFIFTGDKFYQVTAAGPKDYVNGEEVKKFMESFKIKD